MRLKINPTYRRLPIPGLENVIDILKSKKCIVLKFLYFLQDFFLLQVLATTKPLAKFPLPNMPPKPKVHEYNSLRKCDSITVGWEPSPDRRAVHYCLVVKEGKLRELEGYKMPNQCGLENRLRKSRDFAVKYCQKIQYSKK